MRMKPRLGTVILLLSMVCGTASARTGVIDIADYKGRYDTRDMTPFVYTLLENGETVSEGSVLFGVPQIYEYADPKLTARVEGDEIVVSAEAYAGSVAIRNENDDLLLSDNYFDMEAGEKRVKILSGSPERLQLFSLNACGR